MESWYRQHYKIDKARECYEKVSFLDPLNISYWDSLASCYDNPSDVWRKPAKAFPGIFDFKIKLDFAYAKEGKFNEAFDVLDKEIEKDEYLPFLWIAKAALLVKKGKLKKAIRTCENILESEVRPEEAHFLRAYALANMEKWAPLITQCYSLDNSFISSE